MPYIPPSVVREVKRMDLLTYLKNYEPYELVHFSGNTYTTRTHDSLKISNGKWMWWSQRTGGRSALDYLIKVRGYSFLEAVELLAERANIQPSLSVSENVPMEKQLLLPKKNQDDQKVIAYLLGCGIDKEISFHLARHTFATLTLSKGVSIESVSKMLGHTNVKTTQIYAKVVDEKKQKATKAIKLNINTEK